MAITLGALPLPDNLHWSDEFSWSPVAQSAGEYSLTGALLLQESAKQAGRPITLVGLKDGNDYSALIKRDHLFLGGASIAALRAALYVAQAAFTLTLHDSRQFRVAPRHDGGGPLKVSPLNVYKTFPLANPGADTLYALEEIRLIEITP